MDKYYELPISFSDLIKQKKIPKVDLFESVDQHIYLILVTRFESFRFDPEFGCSIWDYDFEVLPKITAWRNQMAHAIALQIEKSEPRLVNVAVKVEITLETLRDRDRDNIRRVKRKIRIGVNGTLAPTNEPFKRRPYEIFFSPISHD